MWDPGGDQDGTLLGVGHSLQLIFMCHLHFLQKFLRFQPSALSRRLPLKRASRERMGIRFGLCRLTASLGPYLPSPLQARGLLEKNGEEWGRATSHVQLVFAESPSPCLAPGAQKAPKASSRCHKSPMQGAGHDPLRAASLLTANRDGEEASSQLAGELPFLH